MPRFLFAFALVFCVVNVPVRSEDQKTTAPGHYLFAWTGDVASKGNDFLAVIDADPAAPSYGHLVTTVATDQPTMYVHHTEFTMPASGMLFANDHDAGRTFIFDVRDPLHPKVETSFTDMAATCIRIPSCGYPTATCSPPSSTRITGGVKGAWARAHYRRQNGPAPVTTGVHLSW